MLVLGGMLDFCVSVEVGVLFDASVDGSAVAGIFVGDWLGVLYSFELVPDALFDVSVDLDEEDEDDEADEEDDDDEVAARSAEVGLMMGDEADFARLGRGDEEADDIWLGLACWVGVVCVELMGEDCAERVGEGCGEGVGEASAGGGGGAGFRGGAGSVGGGGAGTGGMAGTDAGGCAGLMGEVWEACAIGVMPKMPPHWTLILSRRCWGGVGKM